MRIIKPVKINASPIMGQIDHEAKSKKMADETFCDE